MANRLKRIKVRKSKKKRRKNSNDDKMNLISFGQSDCDCPICQEKATWGTTEEEGDGYSVQTIPPERREALEEAYAKAAEMEENWGSSEDDRSLITLDLEVDDLELEDCDCPICQEKATWGTTEEEGDGYSVQTIPPGRMEALEEAYAKAAKMEENWLSSEDDINFDDFSPEEEEMIKSMEFWKRSRKKPKRNWLKKSQ